MILEFVIPGEPVAKGRPRVNTKTGKAFTPRETREAENKVATVCRYQAAGVDVPISDGLIALEVEFYSAADPRKVTGRTDADNLLKLVMDSLNKVIWDDDWRVVEIHTVLYRECDPADARTVIRVQHEAEERVA